MESLQSANLFDVRGLVVVITGGGTGIGLMMTKAFALNGAAKVFIVGRRKEKLDEAAKLSPNIIPVVGDITSKDSLQGVVDRVKREAGYVNFLCCNSGVGPSPIPIDTAQASVQEFAKAALDQGMDSWNSTFAANITGVAFTAFSFLELLAAGNHPQNRGPQATQSSILVTGSVGAFVRGPKANLAYGCSKSAVTMLVKTLADKLIPYDIRMNAIAPGLFPSDMSTGLVATGGEPKGGDPTVEGAYSRSFIPAQRLGKTEDIAGIVLFLASAAAAYLNGCILLNDGGRLGLLPGTY